MTYGEYIVIKSKIEDFEDVLIEKAKCLAIILKNGEKPQRANSCTVDFCKDFAYFYWTDNRYGDNDTVGNQITIPVDLFDKSLEKLKIESQQAAKEFDEKEEIKKQVWREKEKQLLERREKAELKRLKEKYEYVWTAKSQNG